ncbi:MAG: hypothetical protein L3V56_11280 [Candidatus Magnetoovum sp. WYHC-5]|nr:hypothetical protein [Candidatus Magnetoovum sp. WYHC-5]
MAEKYLAKLKKTELSIRQLKKNVKELVEKNDFEEVYRLIESNKRALSALLALSYDKTQELSWRAIHYAGKTIGRMAVNDYNEARVQVQRLLWNASDESGTIPWTVVEILGEAIRENPQPFDDIVSIIVGFAHSETEDNILLPGVLYAFGRIGEVHNEYIANYVYELIKECLTHKDAEVCANAIIAAKRLNVDINDYKNKLQIREEPVTVYLDDKLIKTTLSELATKL